MQAETETGFDSHKNVRPGKIVSVEFNAACQGVLKRVNNKAAIFLANGFILFF
jgi:hypothetical protein